MCSDCEARFDWVTKQFDKTFEDYRCDNAAGRLRDTPATRIHDLALSFTEMGDKEAGRILTAWFLAVAMERLMALEIAGVPT